MDSKNLKTYSQETLELLAEAKLRKRKLDLTECFAAENPESRANKKQDIIHQDTTTRVKVVRSGNQSGKTALMVRDYAWKLGDNHPYWKRRTGKECPKCYHKETTLIKKKTRLYQCGSCEFKWVSWEGDRLTFLAVFQTGKHIDDIFETRLRPFFDEDEIKVEVKGGILQSVTHRKTGNKIIFFSHDNPTEVRKRIQYFSAHDAWIDEMPGHYKVYEELIQRVRAKMAQVTFTLTPKVTNIEVKDYIDNLSPDIHVLYRMNMFDNPIYSGREEEELATMSSLPESVRNAALYGDWIMDIQLRLNLDPDKVRPLPEHYSKTWDHIECVDPAASGKIGYVLLGKDPVDLTSWWVVKACYIKGEAPSQIVRTEIPKIAAGFHLVKKVADSHETGFIKEAILYAEDKKKEGVTILTYESPYDKTHRRKELLNGLEEALIKPDFFFAEGECDPLIKEINSAVEDPTRPGHIKNATKYHCIDACIYGLDLLPEYSEPPQPLVGHAAIRAAWVRENEGPEATEGFVFHSPIAIGEGFKKSFQNKTFRRQRRSRR